MFILFLECHLLFADGTFFISVFRLRKQVEIYHFLWQSQCQEGVNYVKGTLY